MVSSAPPSPPPSVLVLHSSCLTSSSEEVPRDTSTAAAEEGKTARDDDKGDFQRTLQHLHESTPVQCDITVLPEIPPHDDGNDTSHKVKDGHLFLERQRLNPCGMDNVFLLQDLPPTADGSGHLLSLTSCQMSLTQLETTNRDVTMDPVEYVSVGMIPSTFAFRVGVNGPGDSSESSPKTRGVHTAMETVGSSADLNVIFDLGPLECRLEALWDDMMHRETLAKQDDDTAGVEPSLQDKASPLVSNEMPQSPPPLRQEPQCSAHSRQQRDELLVFLQDLAAQEARDLERLLAGLLGVVVLAMVLGAYHHMARRPPRRAPRKNHRPVVPRVPPTVRRGSAASVSSSAHHHTGPRSALLSNVGGEEPPVKTVSVDRNDSDALTPISLEPALDTGPRKNTIPPSIVADLSPDFEAERRRAISQQDGLPHSSPFELAAASRQQEEKENIFPVDQVLVPAHPKFANEEALSPCSKLAHEWKRNKLTRRGNRGKVTKAPRLVPHLVGNVTTGGHRRRLLSPASMAKIAPEVFSKSSITSDSTPLAREPSKAVFSATPDTKGSTDYWGY